MPDAALPQGQPLAGVRVLVTRSPERSVALVGALQNAGASALVLPLIDFERAPDQHALDLACDALGAGAYDWLVVSSATTVHVLAAKAAERGVPLDRWIPPTTRIAAVGAATCRLLEARGLVVALTPADEQSAAGLLAVWQGPGRRVLLPQADIASPRLAEGLAAAGSSVTAVTAYCTVDYPAAAERRLAVPAEDAVVLFADTGNCRRRTRRGTHRRRDRGFAQRRAAPPQTHAPARLPPCSDRSFDGGPGRCAWHGSGCRRG
jgi:uroporphyrinogen-III synthase